MASNGGKLDLTLSYYFASTSGTAGSLVDQYGDTLSAALLEGTGDGESDRPWSHAATLTNTFSTFTLSALPGPGSGTTAMARVLWFYLLNLAAAPGNVLSFAPGSSHPWAALSAGFDLGPGGRALFVGDYAAVAAASDQFKLTATGTCPYVVVAVGVSV